MTFRSEYPALVAALALAVSGTAPGPRGTVSGSLTYDGHKAALVEPYVHESADKIVVMLASKQLPQPIIPLVALDFFQRRQIYGLAFTIDRAKRAIDDDVGAPGIRHGVNLITPDEHVPFGYVQRERYALELTRLDATRIEGRIFTPTPVNNQFRKYQFDVTFSIALGPSAPAPPPRWGTISGDTSAPARVYADFYRAVFEGDVRKRGGTFPSERRAAFEKACIDSTGKWRISALRTDPPFSVVTYTLELHRTNPAVGELVSWTRAAELGSEITMGKPVITGTTATLRIQHVTEDAKNITEVALVQEGGEWKVAEEKPRGFDGIAFTGFSLPDGRKVPAFVTVTPDGIGRATLAHPANVSQDDILAALAADGVELRQRFSILEPIMGAKELFSFKVGGSEADDMLVVIVHPQIRPARGKIFKNPVTYTPGRVVRLAEALERFGEPTQTQVWSSEPAKDLGLDALVHWWGEVGVSAGPDGTISHILLRKIVNRM